MKTVLLTYLLVISAACFGQTSTDVPPPPPPGSGGPVVNDRVFNVVEQMPEYPGGEAEMVKLIQSNIIYPKAERKKNIQGRVVVGFTVNEDGSISDVTIKKSVSPGIDAEAMRLINLFPKFKPGKQQGKAIKVAYIVPIMFKLSSN